MERSPDGKTVDNAGDGLRRPERKTRRRFVQSTLFSRGSQEDGEDKSYGEEDEETEEDDGEEFVERKSKSKKRKRKTQLRAPKKAPVTSKKVMGTKNGNLSVTFRSDFFVKVSERKLQQKQQREQQETVDLTMGNNELDKDLESLTYLISGSLLKGKKRCKQLKESAASSKDRTSSDAKSPHCRRKITDNKSNAANDLNTQNGNTSQTAFDLRLEAKIAAEEYARLSAGRETHPFFSSWKATRRLQEPMEITETEREWCSQEDGITSYPPVHIFETLQDDLASIDWKDWVLCEGTSLDSSYTENRSSSVFEGSVEPLKFDSFITVPSSHQTSFPQAVVCLDQLPDHGESMLAMPATGPSMLANGQEECLLAYLKVQDKKETGYVGNMEDAMQVKFLRERLLSCKFRCSKQPSCILWTNKYQPENAFEVCGNGESVKFLSDWLHSWHENVPQINKHSAVGDDCDVQDSGSWCQNDSDAENTDGRAAHKNVLLITGPVGSGKSAAVYACAKEQGFHVIEVNASDWRNGANVKQKFGEAMESHGFSRWSSEDPVHSQRKHTVELSMQSNCRSSQESDCEVIGVISTTCKQVPLNVMGHSETATENKTTSSQGANKTLILFEDVDTIFDEDRGFIATLLQLAETAKRPMILTSNSKDPVLPQLLDRLVVDFTLPSSEELLSALYMVCAAEKADIPPRLIELFIRCCQGDIRKAIMLLQFWCQGKSGQGESPEWKMQCMYSPLQFDIDAGHRIIPKVIPWGFPWKLSTLVEKEVSQALSLVKEGELNSSIMPDALDMDSNEKERIKAKKEAMLRNCSVNESAEFASQFDVIGDFSNASGSPVAFARRTARRKLNAVLSSDSEDDRLCTDNFPATSDILSQDLNCELFPDVSSGPLLRGLSAPGNIEPSTDQICHPEGDKLDQNLCRSPEMASDLCVCDTYKSVDISCVPESSFVPETEVNSGEGCPSGAVSCGQFSLSSEDVSLRYMNSIQSLSMAEANNPDKTVTELNKNLETMLGNTTEVDAESVHENEELEDSQNEDAEAVTRGYPVLDECSRADFSLGFTSVENPTCPLVADLVQETWRKLRGRREELKSHVTPEQKDACQIVNLASGLTNLISEADVMLSGCQPLISDYLDPMMVPCVEPAAMCWYDEQLKMTSTFAQHGLCLYAKKIAAVGSNFGYKNRADLAQEMLACSTNTMALGKLVTQEMSMGQNSCNLEIEPPQIDISRREVEPRLYGTVLSIVPAKSRLALKGATLHEYLSSLSQISKSEGSRMSGSADMANRRRRVRVARHYLRGPPLMLSPEEIKLLAQYGCFGEVVSEGSCE
ncbi:uncharacterized protein LOC131236455 isoform X2 [Magnolia sinica]|uniref:uncharacterized protein LOC131236455 isoform X2 n=1 Tax=Magnolia sinica TaxID=86752 RepID=UPI00265B0451|nr:uncharacterized protein LOC131236455 isoform X2 [Magnolia sinica]